MNYFTFTPELLALADERVASKSDYRRSATGNNPNVLRLAFASEIGVTLAITGELPDDERGYDFIYKGIKGDVKSMSCTFFREDENGSWYIPNGYVAVVEKQAALHQDAQVYVFTYCVDHGYMVCGAITHEDFLEKAVLHPKGSRTPGGRTWNEDFLGVKVGDLESVNDVFNRLSRAAPT